MEIAVYVSINFANEDSSLQRALDNTTVRKYKKTRDGEELYSQPVIKLDKSSSTTLRELYNDGWKIQSQSRIQPGWYMFFMERG